jgi:hypothetical protein
VLPAVAGRECAAVPKCHLTAFGRWTAAKSPDGSGTRLLDLKLRALLVDTRVKEYTTGNPHELTDRSFLACRAFRVSDALPSENAARWYRDYVAHCGVTGDGKKLYAIRARVGRQPLLQKDAGVSLEATTPTPSVLPPPGNAPQHPSPCDHTIRRKWCSPFRGRVVSDTEEAEE